MAKRVVLAGSTSQSIDIFVQDSSSTTGAGLSGLTCTSSGLAAYYRMGATGVATAITLTAQTATGAYLSGGFAEIHATNMKGMYRLDIPNAALTATPYALFYVSGAANMATNVSEVEIVSYNAFDGVRLGLTALPNAAASSVGGLPVMDANSLIEVDVRRYNAQTVSTSVSGIPAVDIADIAGAAVSVTTAQLGVNVVKYNNQTVTTQVSGVPKVDVLDWLGTGVSAISAGVPDVNVKNYNNQAVSTSVSGIPAVDLADILGSAVSATTAQLGTNVVKYNNQTVTTAISGIPKVDILAVNTDSTAAGNVGHSMRAICRGTVGATAANTLTSFATTVFAPGVGAIGQFIGRTIIFDADTGTTALQGQATSIQNSTNSSLPVFTVTALTNTPALNDTFSIV